MATATSDPTNAELQERLQALELRVRELELGKTPGKGSWRDVVGTVTDPEGFEEVLRYGRAFRESHPYCDTESE